MGLKQRLIAKILIEDGVAVKYKRFTESRRIVGDPVSTVRVLHDQIVDEFYICFLGAINIDLVKRITDVLDVPVAVGGGIHKLDDVRRLMSECVVEKIVIKDVKFAEEVAKKLGAQSVVMPVDYRGTLEKIEVPDVFGEVFLTSIDRDGTGTGLDLAGLRVANTCSRQPITIGGGCGKLVHVKDALVAGAHGVVVSNMFAFTDKSPIKLRSWLLSEGANVRPCPPQIPENDVDGKSEIMNIFNGLSESQIEDLRKAVDDAA